MFDERYLISFWTSMDTDQASDKYYDRLYVENPHIWWVRPCITLERNWQIFDKSKPFLDLWCWQWRNALYMARNWFSVEAIDTSIEAIEQLRRESTIMGFDISARCREILDYPVSDKYWVISLINVISFWKRQTGLDYLESLKKSVWIGAHIVITWLLQEDTFFQDNPEWLFFEVGELKGLFSGFTCKFYQEDSFIDPPHDWYPYPHQHAFARIVCQKAP